ncbi:transcriptional regulator, LysR family [Methylovorus glucosotrophus SIP3-4]|uniref:Transcriptional regulator, LysR family n=1 Tax=Methylovorus glucosotrophus (strain SIP3-4) TaxID=582744 RepID=C6XBG6_METGS|nr:transcriptional regulator, LysR family [Methylovorus glucosotrophus SIP3-4]
MTCLSFNIILKIKNLADLELFITTAQYGSLSAAARSLEISPAVASAALKRLESELGVLLFVRTTRSLRLTAEGERLLARSQPLINELRDLADELVAGHSLIRGELSLSLPSDLGRNVILPWLDEFQQQHPDLHLRVQLSDRIADVMREPVDVAIRYGQPPDSSQVALPLVTDNRRVLCAAPHYLATHGTPSSPAELSQHNCLCFRVGDALYNRWRFTRDGEVLDIDVRGNRSADDADAVRHWTVSGYGICYRSWLDVGRDVTAGRLSVICPQWQGESLPLNLICPDRRQLSPTIRLLREHLQHRFEAYVLQANTYLYR